MIIGNAISDHKYPWLAGEGAFDPSKVANTMLMWNDAEFVTKDGGGFISAFDDLVPGGGITTLTQSNGTWQPQQSSDANGIHAGFDGSDDRFDYDLGFETRDITTFFLIAFRSFNLVDFFTIGNGSNGARCYWDTATRLRLRVRKADTSYQTYVWTTNGFGIGLIKIIVDNPNDRYTIQINDDAANALTIGNGGFYVDNAGVGQIGSAGLGASTYDRRIWGMYAYDGILSAADEQAFRQYIEDRHTIGLTP